MTFPILQGINRKRRQHIMQFGGYNASYNRGEHELRAMKNLTSTYFPFLAPRGLRKEVKAFTNCTHIGAKGDKFYWIDGTNFYYNGVVKGQVTAGDKQIVSINDFIVIFPDKKHYDVINDKFESIGISISASSATFLNDKDKLDCSLTITGGNFTGLKAGDGIKIEGCSIAYNNRAAVIKEVLSNTCITFDQNTFKDGTSSSMTIARPIPDMDFVIEAENRLWGCKKNEIYASKQGDHLNFNVFAGLSTDSYATSVGTDGPFTAAINFSNSILFFKEDCIHRIFGNKPSNYQILTTSTNGVQLGCYKSLAIANEVLFYKARKGIMVYNGSIPEYVSQNLGYDTMGLTIGGSDGKKYYASIEHNGKYELFIYDAILNVWHKEDETQARTFVTKQGVAHFLNAAGTKLMEIDANTGDSFEWSATLGPFNEVIGEKKGYSKLQIRAELDPGSTLEVWVSHNGGTMQHAQTIRYTSDQMRYVLLQLRRCDYFEIELRGRGPGKVHSIIREFFEGSDMNNER